MTLEIILVAIVLILCIAADKFSGKFGMPALILFIGIGMLFGCDGIAGIEFDISGAQHTYEIKKI